MEDSQREAMYTGWARTKKWIKVELYKSIGREDEWKACAEHTFGCVYRPTRILAIQKMQGMLVERGYEIANLSELMGISKPEVHNDPVIHTLPEQQPKRRTFLEWLRKIEFDRQNKKLIEAWLGADRVVPKRDFVDPLTEAQKEAFKEYPSRKLKRILDDLNYNK